MDFSDAKLIVYSAVAILIIGGAIYERRKRAAAKSQPMVVGTVEQIALHEESRKYGSVYFPQLLYSYQVNGEYYSGQYVIRDGRTNSDEALALAKPWLKRRIFVHYQPNHPGRSVFLREDPFPP
jgi:hypothetical protein